jgi:hypothetical protein
MAMTCRRLLRRPASAAVVSEAFDIPREIKTLFFHRAQTPPRDLT